MGTLERFGAGELRAVARSYRDALRNHQDAINRLNVYPVPDGDTGTNMALTIESVLAELEGAEPGMGPTCKAISHGSLMGARGNSGVILSQVLRGIATTVSERESIDGEALAQALGAAAEAAYGAVMRPVEGTILTVVREAAEAAREAASEGEALAGVLDAARRAGAGALDRTPEMLKVLADAGVVDAGGAGFLLLLDAMLHVGADRPLPEPGPVATPEAVRAHVGAAASPGAEHRAAEHGAAEHGAADHGDVGDLRYEVMYLLEAPDETIAAFKDVWAGIGDSIVVVGGDGLWNCHIHTDDIGAAIEAALDCGRPRDLRVTDLREQVQEERWVREGAQAAAAEPQPPPQQVPTAVVAVATGEGLQRIFHSLGAQTIVAGGQSMNPSTAQLVDAVERSPAPEVVILPNNKNIIPVAEQVDSLTAKAVRVVPTTGITEGFAALLAYDPQAPVAENADAMDDAAGSVVSGEVTGAVRDSVWEGGAIREGDWMGLARDGIKAVDPTLAGAACRLLDVLVTEEHEVVTIIEGEGATAADTRRLTEWLAEHRAGATAEVHHGGQPLYPYLFGVE